MRTRVVVISLLVAVITGLSFSASALATPLNRYEKQLLSLVNKKRAKRDLPRLRIQKNLLAAARAHSKDMGTRKYFKHATAAPNSQTTTQRILRHGYKRKGYRTWRIGENLYYGAGLASSPVAVVQAWMKSKAHRAVLLRKSFRDVGIGAVEATDGYKDISGSVWFFTLNAGRRTPL
jgi:uncharacterized protein YkwD